jgi:hypothetical protein
MNNKFEVLICCYGDYLDIAKRCIGSLLRLSSQPLKIHIGTNECGIKTKIYLRNLFDKKDIATLIESNTNLNKDPMMRKLIDCVNSEYFLWLDDDSYITENLWDVMVNDHIQNHQFDVSGFPHYSNRLSWPYNNPPYHEFLKQRPWFNNITQPSEADCLFPVGGCWLAKTEYIRQHNYPDHGMHLRWHQHRDDMLIGDMIKETQGKFVTLFGWDSIFKVNKSPRRGEKTTS